MLNPWMALAGAPPMHEQGPTAIAVDDENYREHPILEVRRPIRRKQLTHQELDPNSLPATVSPTY